MVGHRTGRLVAVAIVAAAGIVVPAAAQVAGTPQPPTTPLPSPTASVAPNSTATLAPLPVPPAPVITVPRATPITAAAPTSAATRAARSAPEPTPTPREAPAAERSEAAVPGATTPAASPPPATPAPAVSPAAVEQASGVSGILPIALGVAFVGLLALGWVMLRRRRADGADSGEAASTWQDEPLAADDAPPLPRARLAMAFRPIRAGLNLLSATAESEVVVTNIGNAAAEDVRVLTRLVSAHAGQDADIAEIVAVPIARPAVPAFTLQPGEQRVVTSVAALPRDAIRPLTAGGRPMFVPIVAVNVTYASGEIAGQLAQAFAVGIERADSSKLAPFWLDSPPRSFDQVAARPHAAAVER